MTTATNMTLVGVPPTTRRLDPFVVALLSNKPWAMEESALNGMFELIQAQTVDAFFFDFLDEPVAEVPTLDVRSGVAVVPISGPLVDGTSYYSYYRGGEISGYDTLTDLLSTAATRSDVDSVMLAINSPGGEAIGVTRVVDAVRAIDKPVAAYARQASSAAYWIASAADNIMVDRGAPVGSIGVMARYSDFSEADAKRGYRFGQVVSSNAPAKRTRPVDEEVLTGMQSMVDELEDEFVGDVARGRNASMTAVREGFGRGASVFGMSAVSRGMVDGIGTQASVEESLRQSQRGLT